MQRSSSRFGLSPTEWSDAKAELRSAIVESAERRQMTSYGEIAVEVDAVSLEPYSPLMNHLLGEIFRDEQSANRPALTAIVTHKRGDLEPGPGFYEMARSLGERFDDRLEYWAMQVQEVFKIHGGAADSRSPRRGMPS